jgi:anti-sigma B factor antagonist
MDVDATTTEDQLALVRVRGFLDTKSSTDFERKMLELLHGGARGFALDFSKLDMITSAGIRILMMVVKRLGGPDRVALWGLNEQVKVVFQIAGLAGVFPPHATQQAAVDQLKKPVPTADADAVQASKMTRLITRLLGDSNQAPARRQVGEVSKMTEEVAELLKNPKS